jgi:hypothetical protein
MSNWIDYNLDVLAGSAAEINHIAERLNQPSSELANWIAQRDGQPLSTVREGLKVLLDFKAEKNLGYVSNDFNKARRFSISFKDRHYGIIDSHLTEISEAFPAAVFLLEYHDAQASYSGKRVMRAGEVVQEVFDGDQNAQGLDWALLDIFAPFRTEYYGEEHAFGTLWVQWLDAVIAAVNELQHREESDLPESPNVAGQQVNVTEVRSCLIPDCSHVGTHRAPGGTPKDCLCCEHYEQFIAHLLDPLGNPTFPK